jgi:hypothetical protein
MHDQFSRHANLHGVILEGCVITGLVEAVDSRQHTRYRPTIICAGHDLLVYQCCSSVS